MVKQFKLSSEQIKPIVVGWGNCVASDRITVHGKPVGYMYRDPPQDPKDSGWRFIAGDEPDDYLDNVANLGVYTVNVIANFDANIVAQLNSPEGSAFERGTDGKLHAVAPRPNSAAAWGNRRPS